MPSTPDAAMKTEDMEIPERLAHFELLFGRLKRNRELLSLRELKTTYAEAYGELVAELRKNQVKVHTGALAGRLLVDVLAADLLEAA